MNFHDVNLTSQGFFFCQLQSRKQEIWKKKKKLVSWEIRVAEEEPRAFAREQMDRLAAGRLVWNAAAPPGAETYPPTLGLEHDWRVRHSAPIITQPSTPVADRWKHLSPNQKQLPFTRQPVVTRELD